MEQVPITVEFQLSEEIYSQYGRFFIFERKKKISSREILLFCLIAFVYSMLMLNILDMAHDGLSLSDLRDLSILILFHAAFIGRILYIRYIHYRRQYRSYPYLSETVVRYEFQSDQLLYFSKDSTTQAESRLSYVFFKKIIETPNYFFLIQGVWNKVCIPKRYLDPSDQDKLRHLLQSVFKDRFFTRRKP